MTKYFKTVIHYEILSADEPFSGSLEDANYETMEGSMSGRFLDSTVTELTKEEAHAALVEQGSDETFLDPMDEDEDEE